MLMMSNGDVQDHLQRLLGAQELFPLVVWTPPETSTRPEFEAFLRNVPKHSEVIRKTEAQRRWELLEYVFSFSRKERNKLLWRWFTDRWASPPPPGRRTPPKRPRSDKPARPRRKDSGPKAE